MKLMLDSVSIKKKIKYTHDTVVIKFLSEDAKFLWNTLDHISDY